MLSHNNINSQPSTTSVATNTNNRNDELFKESQPNVLLKLRECLGHCCRPQTLLNKFPILLWLPKYQWSYLMPDFIAGFTVGLTTIPQAIAYGVVAGLEPQYGLYSAFMGCFVYIIFGSCKDVTIATTAIMALMVNRYVSISPEYAVMVCFSTGCIILIAGLLNLGVLVRFISVPVITGFTIAAATTIGSAQINNLFGMASPSKSLTGSWKYFFTHLSQIRWPDATLGVCSLIFLLLMKKSKNIPYGNRFIWKYVALSRNAVAVIVGTFLAYILSRDGHQPFQITGNITAGLPPFRPPPFSINVNGTVIHFGEMVNTVGVILLFTPMVAVLEIMAIAKTFSKGKIVNASQEMIALGMCNIMGSFVSSMPVTGSFTRTAVNNASGVKTPLGGLVTGSVVLMALAFLTQTFYFIPKATLAAIIIAAMSSLMEFENVFHIWRSKRTDLLPFIITLLPGLFWSLENGILCGILSNILFILYSSAKPKIELYVEKISGVEVGMVKIHQNVNYAAAEYIKEAITKFVTKCKAQSHMSIIIVDGSRIRNIDSTVGMNMVLLKEDLQILNCELICWNWNKAAAGVICRLSPTSCNMFQFNKTLEEIIEEISSQNLPKTSSQNTLYSVTTE